MAERIIIIIFYFILVKMQAIINIMGEETHSNVSLLP